MTSVIQRRVCVAFHSEPRWHLAVTRCRRQSVLACQANYAMNADEPQSKLCWRLTQFDECFHVKLNLFFRPQYIGTIGSPHDWRCPSPNEKQSHDYAFRFPADLKHVVSATTLKVLEGGNSLTSRSVSEVTDKEAAVDFGETATSYATASYQRISRQASSKKDAGIDDRRRYEKPTLDISLPHVCVPLSLLNSQKPWYRLQFTPSFFFSVFITDPRLQPSENSSDSRNQPAPDRPQMLGDKQSTKFTVHLPRTGWLESRIKANMFHWDRIKF